MRVDAPANAAALIRPRGGMAFANDDLLPHYPAIPDDGDDELDTETWLYDEIRLGPGRDDVTDYPDFRSYIRDVAGGLSPANAAEAGRLGAYALDVNSGVESAPGQKDSAKLDAFFEALRPAARSEFGACG